MMVDLVNLLVRAGGRRFRRLFDRRVLTVLIHSLLIAALLAPNAAAGAVGSPSQLSQSDVEDAVRSVAETELRVPPLQLRRAAAELLAPHTVEDPRPQDQQHVLPASMVARLLEDNQAHFFDQGRIVFGEVLQHDVELIRRLTRLLDSPRTGSGAKAAFLEAMVLLLRADRHIARLVLADARIVLTGAENSESTGVSDVDRARARLTAAEQRLDSAIRALERGDGDSAAHHFAFTWSFADEVLGIFSVSFDGDRDGDGLLDVIELRLGTSLFAADSDGDGLPDRYEAESTIPHTLPTEADSDGDGLSDAAEDLDGDGLTNADELTLGTDPLLVDSDEDGVEDGAEAGYEGLDPLLDDSDGDVLLDGAELNVGADPADPDSDGDGLPDGQDTFEQSVDFGELGLQVDLVGVGDHSEALRAHSLMDVQAFADVPGLVTPFVDLSTTLPLESVRIEFGYADDSVPGADSAGLRLVRYDYDEGRLELLADLELDTASRSVSGSAGDLGAFGLIHLPTWEAEASGGLAASEEWGPKALARTLVQSEDSTATPTPLAPSPVPTDTPTTATATATKTHTTEVTETPTPSPTPTVESEPLRAFPTLPSAEGASEPQLGILQAEEGVDPLDIASGPMDQHSPVVAFDHGSDRYLTVWVELNGVPTVRGRLISPDGTPASEVFTITESIVDTPLRPQLVYNPTAGSFLLTWTEANGGVSVEAYRRGRSTIVYELDKHNLYALELGPDGQPLGAGEPALITDELTLFDQRAGFDLACRRQAEDCLVIWQQPRGGLLSFFEPVVHPHRLMGVKVAADGTPTTAPTLLRSVIGTDVALVYAAGSDEYLAVFDLLLTGETSFELVGQRLDPESLEVRGGFNITGGRFGWQIFPHLAYDSQQDRVLVTWWDSDEFPNDTPELHGRLLIPETDSQTNDRFVIFPGGVHLQFGPAAYSPVEARYLTVAAVGDGILAQRVLPDGSLEEESLSLGPVGILGGVAARSAGDLTSPRWLAVWNRGGDIEGGVVPEATGGLDSDHDGLTDAQELAGFVNQFGVTITTDSQKADSDGDGIPDGDEVGDLVTEGGRSYWRMLADPRNPDTDGDEVEDFVELFELPRPTRAFSPDTDGDDLDDGQEVNDFGTDPHVRDTDGDGVWDGTEVSEDQDPLLATERIPALKAASEFTVGAICGDFCIEKPEHGNLAFLAGLLISGGISAVPAGVTQVIGLLADLRDFFAALENGDLVSVGILTLALVPWIGDVSDVTGTTGRFVARHADVAAELAVFLTRLDWLPEAVRLASLRASVGDEVLQALSSFGLGGTRALRLVKAGVDVRALRLALQDGSLSHLSRLEEFLAQVPIDEATGILRNNTLTVNLKKLGAAQVAEDLRSVRGALSNIKGAYTEWLVEGLRRGEGWELLEPARHVNAAGYDRILSRGDVVRLVEAKAREALRLDDIKNYVHRGQDGRLLFNVDYFRDHVSGALEPEQILRAGTLEVELFVNSSSLKNSGEIVNALAREMGSDIGPGRIFAEYEVIIGGVEETRLVEILLTPISG